MERKFSVINLRPSPSAAQRYEDGWAASVWKGMRRQGNVRLSRHPAPCLDGTKAADSTRVSRGRGGRAEQARGGGRPAMARAAE